MLARFLRFRRPQFSRKSEKINKSSRSSYPDARVSLVLQEANRMNESVGGAGE